MEYSWSYVQILLYNGFMKDVRVAVLWSLYLATAPVLWSWRTFKYLNSLHEHENISIIEIIYKQIDMPGNLSFTNSEWSSSMKLSLLAISAVKLYKLPCRIDNVTPPVNPMIFALLSPYYLTTGRALKRKKNIALLEEPVRFFFIKFIFIFWMA